MKVEDFDFELEESFIAQTPLKNRRESKLLVMDKQTGEINHHVFSDLIDYLEEGDCLVLNDTKVMPARLIGEKTETKARIELMLLRQLEGDAWECLVKPLRRIKVGTKISFGDGLLLATCTEILTEGIIHVSFAYEGIFMEVLDALGEMPLPPYIHEVLEERDRYQTVYAREIGSVAAPTAGLHFDTALLDEIKSRGIEIATVTLHVGLGTFRPMKVEHIHEHVMHAEYYELNEENATKLNSAKRIVAVGTTSTRTLETIRSEHASFVSCSGWTDIFIYPGYTFKAVDALVTNFHLPKSTLVMLVSAFSEKQHILNAYETAKANDYRFFSFGDAMLLK